MDNVEINKKLWKICENFKNKTEIKQDYIEYISVLIIIKYFLEKSFEYIYINRNHFYIGDFIDSAKQEYCKKINDEELFSNIDFKSLKSYRNVGEKNILSKTIEEINEIFSNVPSKKTIANAYEYVLEQAIYRDDITKQKGEFHTPEEIANIMAKLVIDKNNVSVYDPICGSGNLLINAAKHFNVKIYGKENNINYYNIFKTRLILNEIDNKNIIFEKKRDTLKKDFYVDIAMSNPPFSDRTWKENNTLKDEYFKKILHPTTTGEYYYVLNMLEKLKPGGKMAVILPHGVLFRENEKKVREQLVNLNLIRAIIGLPENLFHGTRMAVIIMILCKDRTDDGIMFIDASKEFENDRKNNILTKEYQDKIVNTYLSNKKIANYSCLASKEEIIKNNFDLTIKKYVYKKENRKEEVNKDILIKNVADLKAEQENLEENIKDVLEVLGYKDIGEVKKSENKIQEENVAYYVEEAMKQLYILPKKESRELDYYVIGSRIKRARIKKNLTQEELSERLDISVAFYSRVERGVSHINLKRLYQICEILDVTVSEILEGK